MSNRNSSQWRLITVAITIVFWGSCNASYGVAGSWSSSGGEFREDGQNPWFLENTRVVKYCIDAVRDFPIAKSHLKDIVTAALTYWKEEFSIGLPPHNEGMVRVHIATQDFEYIPQCPGADLHFTFGKMPLNYAQAEFGSHVGITVRTHYDRVHLRGSGFIAIAPDRGLNAMPMPAGTVKEPWSHPQLLYWVLVHELGHVFGIPHSGSTPDYVMNAGFVEHLLSERAFERFTDPQLRLPFRLMPISPYSDRERACHFLSVRPKAAQFFGIPNDFKCVRLIYSDSGVLKVFVRKNDTDVQEVLAGEAGLKDVSWNDPANPIQILVYPEQKVFPALGLTAAREIQGPLQWKERRKGVFKGYLVPVRRAIGVEQASGGRLMISGVLDEELLLDVMGNF